MYGETISLFITPKNFENQRNSMFVFNTRKEPAQARVSTDIFHDGLREETCSETRITLAQYPISLSVLSVHFANFLRGIYAAE